jgi:hypothetical protein
MLVNQAGLRLLVMVEACGRSKSGDEITRMVRLSRWVIEQEWDFSRGVTISDNRC